MASLVDDDEEGGILPPPPVAAPPPAPGVPGGGIPQTANEGGGGGGRNRGGGGPPDVGPVYNYPGLPGFVAPQFVAPTLEQAMQEPGYQFRLQAGQNALERSAAARGVLRSGGTLRDLTEYGQKFGQQEFSNVYNRALQAFDRKYQGAKDTYAPLLAKWQTMAQGEHQRALALYDRQGRNRGGGGGGGGLPPLDMLLGPPPALPDYAHSMGAQGYAAPQTGIVGGGGGGAFDDDEYRRY